MKHWINKNYKTLIIAAFLIPIMTVAVVSISHVTKWYGISNPISWAIYLSIGIEIAALSALAAISADMGKKVYFPFIVVTLIQFIGNIFFAYSYIDLASQAFKDWVDLVSPLVSFMGIESTDMVGHKRFLAFFAGGMLPIISLSFLHMLVKFTEEDRKKEQNLVDEEERHLIDDHLIQEAIEKYKIETENQKVDAKDLIAEVSRVRLSEEDLKKLEAALLNPPKPNDNLLNAKETYDQNMEDQPPSLTTEELSEMDVENLEDYEETLEPTSTPTPTPTVFEITSTPTPTPTIVDTTHVVANENNFFKSPGEGYTPNQTDVISDESSIINESDITNLLTELQDETFDTNVTSLEDGLKKKVLENPQEDLVTTTLEEIQTSELPDSNDNLYWESDDVNPNQIIYDIENNKVVVPTSEDEIFEPTPTIDKFLTRNVNPKRRNSRQG